MSDRERGWIDNGKASASDPARRIHVRAPGAGPPKDHPRDLRELADLVATIGYAIKPSVRLLELMHVNDSLEVEELKVHCHLRRNISDKSVDNLLSHVRALIRLYAIPIRLERRGNRVFKISEVPNHTNKV